MRAQFKGINVGKSPPRPRRRRAKGRNVRQTCYNTNQVAYVLLAEVLYTVPHTLYYAGSGPVTSSRYSTRLSKLKEKGHRYRLTSGAEGKRVRCSAWPPTSKRRNRLKPTERRRGPKEDQGRYQRYKPASKSSMAAS